MPRARGLASGHPGVRVRRQTVMHVTRDERERQRRCNRDGRIEQRHGIAAAGQRDGDGGVLHTVAPQRKRNGSAQAIDRVGRGRLRVSRG